MKEDLLVKVNQTINEGFKLGQSLHISVALNKNFKLGSNCRKLPQGLQTHIKKAVIMSIFVVDSEFLYK